MPSMILHPFTRDILTIICHLKKTLTSLHTLILLYYSIQYTFEMNRTFKQSTTNECTYIAKLAARSLISTTALHILGARQIHQHQTTSFGGLTNHGVVFLHEKVDPIPFHDFSRCLDDVSHRKQNITYQSLLPNLLVCRVCQVE